MLGARQIVPDLAPAPVAAVPRPVRLGDDAPLPAFAPGACARWASAAGLKLGDVAALMVRDVAEAAALRQGLAWVGVRTRDLIPGGDHARVLSVAAVAIVDSALAASYGRTLAELQERPPVWWNGVGADFARFDHAVAEYAIEDGPAVPEA